MPHGAGLLRTGEDLRKVLRSPRPGGLERGGGGEKSEGWTGVRGGGILWCVCAWWLDWEGQLCAC